MLPLNSAITLATFSVEGYSSVSRQYGGVIMSAMAFQITSVTIVYWTVYSGAAQRKHRSSASLVFVRGNHRWPVNSPHKGPVTRETFPFDDVIMRVFVYFCSIQIYRGIIAIFLCWFHHVPQLFIEFKFLISCVTSSSHNGVRKNDLQLRAVGIL